MASIEFDRVRKVFGDRVVALEEFSLEIPSPRLVVLVGPSGCGKTTLLRLLAGLEQPTAGEIRLGGARIDHLPPRRRDVAMVFQSYALYPHMSVRDNMSFGLKIRKVAREVIRQRVEGVAKSLDIDGLLDRKPAELSGGQRQRVALGRAVVREPKVFLFDEPLSNLDARLRDEMRYMIKKLYARLQTTAVYVTHDQVEAMTIGEMLVVMKDGRIHQVGSPLDCYRRPADTFVASFLGSPPMNLMEAVVEGDRVKLGNGAEVAAPASIARGGDRDIIVGARPEDLKMGNGSKAPGVTLEGRVSLTETLGHETLTHLSVGDDEIVIRTPGRPRVPQGGRMSSSADAGSLHFFSKSTGKRIDESGGYDYICGKPGPPAIMTTTPFPYDVTFKDRDRTLVWSLIVSIAIHVVVITPFLKDLIPEEFFTAQARPVVVEPLEFELVSPPQDPTPTNQRSKYLSTVSSAAKDDTQSDQVTDLPHSTGDLLTPDNPSPRDGVEGGGKKELPSLPEEQTDLGQAFERSKLTDLSSPQKGPSLPPETPAFRNPGSARASVGGITINTTAWDFAPYLLDLKQRIKQHWIPPLAFTALGAIHGYTKINFRIYPDGSMEGLEVIDTWGHESLHRSSANAIKGAQPFRKLPADFPEEYLDITFGFYYLLPGDNEETFQTQE
jgi:ABC-type sugar transport system ATPase subunit/outer membrane biosynthesis protein TonB